MSMRGTYRCSEESKARTTLLQSIPDDHVADFHYMDDAKDIWNAVKARPKVKPVPTGKPKVAPVPTGKPKVSTPVPTGKPKVSHQFLLVCQIGLFQFLLIEDIPHRYVVITGRVIVPTGRYVIPTGRVIVPTDRYVVPAGSKDLSRVGSINIPLLLISFLVIRLDKLLFLVSRLRSR
nr:xylulose kinase-1 [Tanacetum cinerariifolium]